MGSAIEQKGNAFDRLIIAFMRASFNGDKIRFHPMLRERFSISVGPIDQFTTGDVCTFRQIGGLLCERDRGFESVR